MGNFIEDVVLPNAACEEQDFYDLVRGLAPTISVVDALTITVVAGKFYCETNVPRWKKVGDAVAFGDLTAAAMTVDIALFTLPAKGVIHGVKIKHSTAFAGPGITAVRLSVGIAGALEKYAAPFDVFQAVSNTAFQVNSEVGGETHAGAGTVIRLAAESEGANLDALTAGVVDVWVLYSIPI